MIELHCVRIVLETFAVLWAITTNPMLCFLPWSAICAMLFTDAFDALSDDPIALYSGTTVWASSSTTHTRFPKFPFVFEVSNRHQKNHLTYSKILDLLEISGSSKTVLISSPSREFLIEL